MESEGDVLELEIAELLNEVGFAIFPVTRDRFKSAWEFRCYLEQIQSEKNANSEIWQRMKNWD